jgi:TRAP-type C4-dicarboxylate transport system substrate-binding protein
VSTTLDAYYDLFSDMLPYLTYTYHARVPDVLVMSQSKWERLGVELGEECRNVVRKTAGLSALVQWGSREREVNEVFNDLHNRRLEYAKIDQERFRVMARSL